MGRIAIAISPLLTALAFGNGASAQSPGGVSGASAWFKADAGVTTVAGNATVWNNSATNPNLLTVASFGTNTYVNNVGGPFNFNPYIQTTGGSYFGATLIGMNDVVGASEGMLMGVGTDADQLVEVTATGTATCGAARCNSGTRGGQGEFGAVGVSWLGSVVPGGVANIYGTNASTATTPMQTSFRNGFQNNGNSGTRGADVYQFAIGSFIGFSYGAGNRLAEVVCYPTKRTAAEMDRIQSYLALKYGVTLGSTASPVNYVNSSGTTVWTGNTIYQNNVIGIGQDNGSGLTQKQSRSVSPGTVITLYNGNTGGTFPAMNASNGSTIPANNSWLVVGSNGLSASTFDKCTYQSTYTLARTGRIWLAQQTGTNGTVTIAAPAASLPAGVRYLLVSSDTSFQPGTSTFYPLQTSGTDLYAAITITNGQYFTYASDTLRIVSASSNSPICEGGTLSLFSTPATSGYTTIWTAPTTATYTGGQNISLGGVPATYNGLFSVRSVAGSCSSPAFTLNVVVTTQPAPALGATSGPTACSGNNGTIAFSGLTAGTTYTITYSKNGSPVSTSGTAITGGTFTLSGLTAGTYTNVVFAFGSCSSSALGPVTLSDPAGPAAPVPTASPNPICAGNSLALSITPVAGNTYSWTGPNGFTSNAAAPTITNITTAGSGTYSVTTTNTASGCTSTPGTVAVTVNPTPVITSVTGVDPTTCGNTGSLVINGLTTGSSYTINYTKNGTAQAAITQTAVAGAVTISGQGNGLYTAISVTLGSCGSNVMGPITLNNPAPPAQPVVNSNSPVCVGQTLNLSTTGPTTNLTYAWTGPNGFVSTSATPSITNVTTAAAGNYSVVTTSTTTNCSSTSGGTTVVVNPTPAISGVASGGGPATCGGTTGSIVISGLASTTAYTVNYLKNGFGASFSGTSTATNTLTITGLTAGTYTNFVVSTGAGCASAPAAGPVVISDPAPPPVPTAGSNSPVCSGATINLTAAGTAIGFAYAWTGPASFTSTVQNPTRANSTTAMSGTYTVTVTNTTTLCTSTSSTNVVVNQTPSAPTAGNNGPICQGATLTLTASTIAGASYAWTGPNGFASAAQNPTISNAQVSASGTYNVFATVNGCTSSTAGTTTVTVRPTPATPIVGNSGPVCSGGTLSLTANATTGATYAWTGPNSFTSTVQNPSITNVTTAANGNYQLIITVNSCPSAPAVTAAVVNPTPAAPTVAALSYCQDEIAPPLAVSGTNLKWYTASTGGTSSPVAPTPNTAVPGVYTWYVSQTSVQGCESPRAALTVTVKAKPAPPVVASPTSYCQYETATALTATGTALRWYSVATGGTGSSTAPVQNTTVAGTYYWYVTQTVNGCESNRQTLQVNVKPKPAPPIVTSPVNICQGDPPYTVTAQGQNLNWYTVPNGGFADPAAPVIQTNTADTFDYYVTQTVNGCESDRALITVIVRYKPYGFIDVSRQYACAEDTITLYYNGNADLNSQYYWTIPIGDATIESGQNTPGPLQIRLIHGGKFQVKLVVNNHGCVSSPIYEDIRVRDLPVLSVSAPENGCVGVPLTVALAGSSMPLDSLEWDFGSASVPSPDRNFGPYSITYLTPGQKVVSVRGRNLGCFSHYATDTIDVHDVPNARIEQVGEPNQKICIGDSVLLRATYDPAWTYQWFPARFFDTVFNRDNQVMAPILAPGYVGVRVSAGWTGCVTIDSVLIEAKSCCDVIFPSAFSPNNDHHNDIFRAVTPGHVETSDFRILNRWGQTVWKGSNGSQGWDGTMHGQEQPAGVYFYYIKYQCNSGNGTGQMIEKSGEVTLVR